MAKRFVFLAALALVALLCLFPSVQANETNDAETQQVDTLDQVADAARPKRFFKKIGKFFKKVVTAPIRLAHKVATAPIRLIKRAVGKKRITAHAAVNIGAQVCAAGYRRVCRKVLLVRTCRCQKAPVYTPTRVTCNAATHKLHCPAACPVVNGFSQRCSCSCALLPLGRIVRRVCSKTQRLKCPKFCPRGRTCHCPCVNLPRYTPKRVSCNLSTHTLKCPRACRPGVRCSCRCTAKPKFPPIRIPCNAKTHKLLCPRQCPPGVRCLCKCLPKPRYPAKRVRCNLRTHKQVCPKLCPPGVRCSCRCAKKPIHRPIGINCPEPKKEFCPRACPPGVRCSCVCRDRPIKHYRPHRIDCEHNQIPACPRRCPPNVRCSCGCKPRPGPSPAQLRRIRFMKALARKHQRCAVSCYRSALATKKKLAEMTEAQREKNIQLWKDAGKNLEVERIEALQRARGRQGVYRLVRKALQKFIDHRIALFKRSQRMRVSRSRDTRQFGMKLGIRRRRRGGRRPRRQIRRRPGFRGPIRRRAIRRIGRGPSVRPIIRRVRVRPIIRRVGVRPIIRRRIAFRPAVRPMIRRAPIRRPVRRLIRRPVRRVAIRKPAVTSALAAARARKAAAQRAKFSAKLSVRAARRRRRAARKNVRRARRNVRRTRRQTRRRNRRRPRFGASLSFSAGARTQQGLEGAAFGGFSRRRVRTSHARRGSRRSRYVPELTDKCGCPFIDDLIQPNASVIASVPAQPVHTNNTNIGSETPANASGSDFWAWFTGLPAWAMALIVIGIILVVAVIIAIIVSVVANGNKKKAKQHREALYRSEDSGVGSYQPPSDMN